MLCVWYSDDGGATYNVSKNGLFHGNEVSIADLGNGTLYMNGRGLSFPWAGHRTAYWSYDSGTTWTPPVENELPEPNTFGCDGALITAFENNTTSRQQPRVFFSEPFGPGSRSSYRVWCSLDGGRTWPRYAELNPGQFAAYSALEYLANENILVAVWEAQVQGHGSMVSYRLPLDWCPHSSSEH
jgi:photosystem II stability/assembly factor-like uncharacterized protein